MPTALCIELLQNRLPPNHIRVIRSHPHVTLLLPHSIMSKDIESLLVAIKNNENYTLIQELINSEADSGSSRLAINTALEYHPDDQNLFRILLASLNLNKNNASNFLQEVMRRNGKANLDMANMLLPYGPHLDLPYIGSGQTMLWYRLVTEPPDLEAVRWLIDHGAKDFFRAGETMTPFDLVIGDGHHAIARKMIDLGAPIDRPGWNEYTPLLLSIYSDDKTMVEMLIEAGIDVNQPDLRGRQPLHFAASQGSHGIVRYLLEKGADPNISTRYGFRALHFARNEDTRGALLESGARSDLELPPERPESAPECPICLDEVDKEDIRVLACHETHFFCNKCLSEWRRRDRDTCPLCRD